MKKTDSMTERLTRTLRVRGSAFQIRAGQILQNISNGSPALISPQFNKYYLQVYDGNLHAGHLFPSFQFRETVVLSRSGSICIEYFIFSSVDNDWSQFIVSYRKCMYFENRLFTENVPQ